MQHSTALAKIRQKTVRPLAERLLLHFARKHTEEIPETSASPVREWSARIVILLALLGIGYGVMRVAIILSGLQASEVHQAALGLGATFLRVNLALFLGALEYVLEDGPRYDWFEDSTIAFAAVVSASAAVLFFMRALTAGQPIVDLATSRVTGAEALVRWWRADQVIEPRKFLAAAEQCKISTKSTRR